MKGGSNVDMKTREIIEQLSVVAFGTSGETERIIRSAMKHIDELETENREINKRHFEVCKSYAEDLDVLHSVLKDNERLKAENEMLWKKQTPLPVTVEVIDYEYDIVKYRCPCCGNRLFKKKAFCESCGQALKTETEEERRSKYEKDLADLIAANKDGR